MKKNFVQELKWRGMLHDIMPGTEELLNKESVAGYIGFDPTADSLGVGNLVQVMTLLHFQQCGHKPIALVGGATGMVGDPSGKPDERNLLDEDTLNHNLTGQKKQLEKILDFNCGANSAEVVNNYDWFKEYRVLDFIREVGKHISVSYMMAKDSVKNRLEAGMSFTEFAYQLFQGYDFYFLWKNKNVKLQLGGSDQWGNIVTGTELIRRKGRGEAFALTTKLITKADGSKFGKTETGNIWLDKNKTSVLEFKNFWLNTSDDDIKTYIRIFSLLVKEEIEELEREHFKDPGKKLLQKTLAKEITIRVHSQSDYDKTEGNVELFSVKSIEEFNSIFNTQEKIESLNTSGVTTYNGSYAELEAGIPLVDYLSTKHSKIFGSKSEIRKLIQGGGISVNFQKVTDVNYRLSDKNIMSNHKGIIIKKGKKEFVLYLLKG